MPQQMKIDRQEKIVGGGAQVNTLKNLRVLQYPGNYLNGWAKSQLYGVCGWELRKTAKNISQE
jgi:hypothetical protein